MKKSVKSDMSDNYKIFAHQMFENCHVAAVRCTVMNQSKRWNNRNSDSDLVTV